MRRPLLAAASLAVLLTASLAACTPDRPLPTPTPSVSSSAPPLFASEEEALAAAEEAYADYMVVSDAVLQEGGADPARLDAVTTGDLSQLAAEGASEFRSNGWRSTGTTVLSGAVLQSLDSTSATDGKRVVIAYICVDVSAVDVVNGAGVSVVKTGRSTVQQFEVGFDWVGGRLVPATREPWDGGDFCSRG